MSSRKGCVSKVKKIEPAKEIGWIMPVKYVPSLEVFEVAIIEGSENSWTFNREGEIFEVQDYDRDFYKVLWRPHWLKEWETLILEKSNCEIIKN